MTSCEDCLVVLANVALVYINSSKYLLTGLTVWKKCFILALSNKFPVQAVVKSSRRLLKLI